MDAVLPNYAEKDWVEATFSTLAQYEATCDTIAKIDARIGSTSEKLSKDIKATADSLTKWVNKQFEGYYTAAQMDAKLAQMKAAVDSAKASGGITDAKADSIATELTNAKAAVDTAKANIRAEYKAAVKSAIEESEGKLTKALNDAIATVNGTITALTGRVDALETSVAALTGRVDALEGMIQSVTIVPAYSDGSVEAINGIVELNLIVSPSSAVEGLTNEKVNILLNTVATKAVSVDTVEADKIKSFTVDKTKGTVEIKADISDKINALLSKQLLTIAVNVTNGDLSDFTTEFVGVKTVVKTLTFKAVYDTKNEANTLTFYYDYIDHSGEGTVYDNLPTAATGKTSWGYDGVRKEIKKVVITESVKNYSDLTSTAYMFQDMTAASDISGAEHLGVSNVTDMKGMFYNFGGGSNDHPTTLNSVPDVSGWNTGKVTNMVGMFWGYGNFSSELDKVPDVSGWNTGEVTNMSNMFQKYGHESQNFNAVPDVSNWNTGKVTNMQQMFEEYAYKSTELDTVPDVSNWNTGKVTNMNQMFNSYGNASTNISCVLDLSGWDLSEITGTNGNNVFAFTPKTFDVTIPAKTGEKSNEGDKWYYGNGTNHIAPPTGKTFTLPAAEPEYVEIGGVKWATKNLGAEKVTDYGDYFVWGTTVKAYSAVDYSKTTDAFTFVSSNPYGDIYKAGSWDATNGFDWINTPFTDGVYTIPNKKVFTKYVPESMKDTYGKGGNFFDNKKVLDSDDDVAHKVLGGTWRMPTKEEFDALCALTTKSWQTDYNGSGVNGYLFTDANGNSIFLPAAGNAEGTGLHLAGDYGYYLSSSLYTDRPNSAYYLGFGGGDASTNIGHRYYGLSVRPVK